MWKIRQGFILLDLNAIALRSGVRRVCGKEILRAPKKKFSASKFLVESPDLSVLTAGPNRKGRLATAFRESI